MTKVPGALRVEGRQARAGVFSNGTAARRAFATSCPYQPNALQIKEIRLITLSVLALASSSCGAGQGGMSWGPAANNSLAIMTTGLAAGKVGKSYTFRLTAVGGKPPIQWLVVSGSLAPGVALDSHTGLFSGIPENTGSYFITVQAADSSAQRQFATATLGLNVTPGPLAIISLELPPAVQNHPYAFGMRAVGGTPPYLWAVSTGSLPAGLALDPQTGVISGTPTVAGTVEFTILVSDSALPQNIATLTVRYAPPGGTASPG